MSQGRRTQNSISKDWLNVDARILGQILAAQNILFVLPDETRIAEYFSQALSNIPGITSCYICFGNRPTPLGLPSDICRGCKALHEKENESLILSNDLSCRFDGSNKMSTITLRTLEHTFGFFIFQTRSDEVVGPYWPFLNNLANYVALSLENRMQKRLLEKSRNELENKVKERTEELMILNLNVRNLNQELEQRVAERTAQLEFTNKELEAFAYSVSHDLRTPLRSIDGFSQALLEEYHDKVDAEGKNYILRVRSASQRMGQLIDDILSLSRISRGEINIRQVNLSNIVHEIANELCDTEPERRVEFIIQDGVVANADARLLRIVLENLFGNAWKFTSKHTTSRIEFGTQQQKDKMVYFVRDDGAGFDMHYAEKLFGAFQRLHSSAEFPGTGIGLATVKRVISRHGGKIWATGEVGKGTTFYFTLC